MTPADMIDGLERRLAPRLPPGIRRTDLTRFAANLRRAGVEHMPELAPLYEALRGLAQEAEAAAAEREERDTQQGVDPSMRDGGSRYTDAFGANVQQILVQATRVIRGTVPMQVRKELHRAVKAGVLGHLPKSGLKPEIYYHPDHKHGALDRQRREAEYAVQGIASVMATPADVRAGIEARGEDVFDHLLDLAQERAHPVATAEPSARWDLAQLGAELVAKADELSRHHLLGDLAFDALSRWLREAQGQAQQPAWRTLKAALAGLQSYRDSGRLSGTIELFLRSLRADEMARMFVAVARQAPPDETSQDEQGSVIERYLSLYVDHRLPDPDDPDRLFAFQRGHHYRLLIEPEVRAAAGLRSGNGGESLDVEASARLAAEQLAAKYGGRMHQIGDLAGHDADRYLEDDLSRRRRRRAHEAAEQRRPPRDALILAWVALEGSRHDQWMRRVQEAAPVAKALAYTSDIKPGDEVGAAGHLADIDKVFGAVMRLPDTPDVLDTARASIMEQYKAAHRLRGAESVNDLDLARDTESHLLALRDNMERSVGAGRKGRPNPVEEMRYALELARWVERLAEIYQRPDFLPYAQSLRARASKPKALKKLPTEERTIAAPAVAAYVAALAAPTYTAKSAALADVATPVCNLVEELRKSPKHPTLPALDELCRLVMGALDYYSQAAQAQAHGSLATQVSFDHPSYALSPEYYRGGTGQSQYLVGAWRPFPVYGLGYDSNPYVYITEHDGRWQLHKDGEGPSYATPQDAAWAALGKRLDADQLRLLLDPPPARLPDADRLLVRVTAIARDLLDDDNQKRERDRLITRLRAGALGRDPADLAWTEHEQIAGLERATRRA